MKVLSIIQCSKQKQSYSCSAREMYSKSKLFTKCFEIATRLSSNIYILSSLYGFLSPDEVIEPYDYGLLPSPYTKELSLRETDSQKEYRRKHNAEVTLHLVEKIISQRTSLPFDEYDTVICFVNSNYKNCMRRANIITPSFDFWFNGSLGLFDLQNHHLDKKYADFMLKNRGN